MVGRARRLTAFAVVASAVVALGACGSSASNDRLWSVQKDPFRVTVGPLRQAAAPARLRYQLPDGTQHALTKVVRRTGSTYIVGTDEPGRTAEVRVTTRGHGVRIETTLRPAAGVTQVYDAFEATRGEHWFGGGERGDAVDLRGQIVPVRVSYRCNEAPAPYFHSSRGYAVRLATDAVAGLAFPGSPGGSGCRDGTPGCVFPALRDRLEVCANAARLVEDVYLGGPAATHASYVRDVGRPAVPPLSQYAVIKWRDEVAGPAELFEDVTRLRAAGTPVGWVLLDNPWETCPGTYRWAKEFPDPAGMIRRLHAQDVKLMLWMSPDVYCADGAGYPRSALVPIPNGATLDLTDPAVMRTFRERIRGALAAGVDGVKGDRADEADLQPRGATLQNRYPVLFQQAVVSELRRLRGNDFATIFRAASPGSLRIVHGFWNGDQPGDFVGLQRTIRQAATAGVAGYGVWGSDIGGYASAGLTPEVFMRWTQLGAVSPVFEVGGVGANATPWVLGAQAMRALAEAARVHYALVPLFDRLARRGEPVLRPLAYGYPGDAHAWAVDLELLVGPDLLAAPVTGPGETPSVYLPRGSWVDLYTGRTIPGGGPAFVRETPYDRFPLYARQGAVIPFALRTSSAPPLWKPGELPGPGRAGYLATDGAVLSLRGQPRVVQLFVPAATRPARVTLGGRAVRFTWEAGPMPGAVVRLQGPTVLGRIALAGT